MNHVSSVTTIRRWKHRCIPTVTLIQLRDDQSSDPLYCRLSLLPIKGDSTHIVSVGGTTGMPKSLANELGYAGTSERWHSTHVYIFESSSCSIEFIRRGFLICNWASNYRLSWYLALFAVIFIREFLLSRACVSTVLYNYCIQLSGRTRDVRYSRCLRSQPTNRRFYRSYWGVHHTDSIVDLLQYSCQNSE